MQSGQFGLMRIVENLRVSLQTALPIGAALWLVAIPAVFGSPAVADNLSIAARFFDAEPSASVDQAAGEPPAAAVRNGAGTLLGYAFSTRAVSGSVGYSGRPIDIVAAVTPAGVIAGARLIAHEEPILVIGIAPEALAAYVAGFKGYDVNAASQVRTTKGGQPGPSAILGASVTSAVIRDAVVRSARAVLRTRIAAADQARPRLDRESLRRVSWRALVEEGAVRRLFVSRGEAARLLGKPDSEPDKPFIELWLALATPPPIGESLLGQRTYESELGKLGPEDDLILIGSSGLYSFKGTEWRRAKTFDRIEIVQGNKTIRLRADDHTPVDALHAAGAPELREIGVFRIARASGFDPTAPFRLDLSLEGSDVAARVGPPVVASLDYRIPGSYLVPPSVAAPADAAAPSAPVAPATQAADRSGKDMALDRSSNRPLWQEIWWARRYELAVLFVMLASLGGIFIFQDAVVARTRLYQKLRIGYLAVTLVFLGYIANAQLSVVNVFTFIQALLTGFHWELFLLDPLVFTLWSFVAIGLLFWGRGVFCGWLCPFGALQELLNRLAQRAGVKQIAVPFGPHERLWMIKYVIFVGLLAVSLGSVATAFRLAEVEPFKTVITLKFAREWPFVIYALGLLAAGLFVQRFFCRYLCPLGGALAIPARMRMFEWLKRYRECGNECHLCARECIVQAIHPLGKINPNECIQCLHCQANYFDGSACLHLKKRAARRRPQTAAAAPASPTAYRSAEAADDP